MSILESSVSTETTDFIVHDEISTDCADIIFSDETTDVDTGIFVILHLECCAGHRISWSLQGVMMVLVILLSG